MSIIVQFGKIILNDIIHDTELNIPVNVHELCDTVWKKKYYKYHSTSKKIYQKNKNKIPEDFFIDHPKYGYELLLILRSYHDDGPQLMSITPELIQLINNLNDEVIHRNIKKRYMYYAKWLKYWCHLCRKHFNKKAFILTDYI